MRFEFQPLLLPLPPLSDETAVLLLDCFQEFIHAFESHYFDQIRRFYQNQRRDGSASDLTTGQLDLFENPDDIPF